ncbi:hypothetical protein OG241_22025 [Streptomyces sp. NBC_01390]|uniref:hypothetical protein n=1 Tax=Streptomyces sp. NBC_01390 TaxID=2903850 RepID=UPI00324AA4B2
MPRDLTQLDTELTSLQTSTLQNTARIDASISSIQQKNTEEFDKLNKTYKDIRTSQSGISNSFAWMTNSITLHTNSLVGLAASFTLLSVGLSIFKVDEKGITILGATREFPWKKQIDKLQKIVESKDQKTARAETDEIKKTVAEIKRRLTKIGEASTERQTDPTKRTERGIDTPRPLVKGVVADVKILRAALDELSAAF